ncbi:MAG: hypothetical protein REH83_05875 [Rickettsiella sp.]|nr:hypothetical protein [Rickettsiella sp.]
MFRIIDKGLGKCASNEQNPDVRAAHPEPYSNRNPNYFILVAL